MNTRKTLCSLVCVPALLAMAAMTQAAQPPSTRAARSPVAAPPPAVIRSVKLTDTIHVLLGAGGNITAQVGAAGILLVNAGAAGTSDAVLAALRQITDRPLRLILNTNAEPHHTGGNEALYWAGRYVGDRVELNHAQISAHEAVLNRLSVPQGQAPAAPEAAWPTDVFYTATIEHYFNGESIVMHHAPAARTDGDAFVYFRKSDVIVAGDLFLIHAYPVIDLEQGGSIQGVIDALNRMIEIAIPAGYQEGGTMIVSGDGRPTDEYDLVVYRDMVTVFRDRVADMIRKGMTLQQALAAKPTRDYDGRYASPSWTADQFVTAVYRSLESAPPTARVGE